MIEIRRILCPTDFSNSSYEAMRCATAVAAWYGAEIYATVVLSRTPQAWSEPRTLDLPSMEPIREDRFVARLSEYVSHATAAGIATRTKVLYGAPAHEIVRYAEEIDADLVVMGTHGRDGFQRLILGSVAEKVLRHATCPILTVREGTLGASFEHPPFKRILCPIDFSPSSLRAVPWVLSLGEEADAAIRLLHVRTEAGSSDAEIARLRALVPEDARDWCHLQEMVTSGGIPAEILRVAETTHSNLIVMGVQRRLGLDVKGFSSTTYQAIRHAPCPVLTIATDRARELRHDSTVGATQHA